MRPTKKARNDVSEIAEGGVTLTDPTEVANSFNKFFSEIGPNLSDKLPNPDYPPQSYVKSISTVGQRRPGPDAAAGLCCPRKWVAGKNQPRPGCSSKWVIQT